uniref:Uncharacterized protein n=1 Tax=Alexandrium catenella TaxID=2925 RepID=A0A7S1Q8N8_ALECA|mmetsp:Transcript_2064/g.5534  ORF Transcript_2064/g.5534 Transcript_2064/m.5534 type:complete len:552 (+) Transcript_2064:143-1798(+)|eukprot:CAMPEP_0171221704 /NCGR_PEP_ID=MMETSP0790-20130122/34891_1 /TAXON_ID=2925 /ORGANISM="Alexandrium catenella, Strain OF101" /LENGTH=551 /DNA_ID=CAMNT_0011687639 /DNA_START=86 /DNA_END=1741 /DNA_ORIENTATION=-
MSNEGGAARQPSFAMEVEDPQSTPRSFLNDPEFASRFFPFELFRCCPVYVKALLPGTWQKIQDVTHLILVAGALACGLFVVQTIAVVYNTGCAELNCVPELVALFFILPCTTYCVRIIGQYDDRLTSKKRDAKEQKANLTRSYNDLLTDMDGLLSKSAESSAGLAERSFESKRRDFQRFLERAKSKYCSGYSGAQGDSDKLLMQFRRFCTNWLKVFEECSIDPVECPKRVVLEEELNRCTSIGDVADLCLERLRVTEVRFISIQRDQDAQMLRRNRNEFRRISMAPSAGTFTLPSPRPQTVSTSEPAGQTQGRRRISWLALGSGYGFKMGGASEGEDGFPKEFRFGCGRLVVLSREHFMLICVFIVGSLVVLLEIYQLKNAARRVMSNLLSIVEIFVAEVCVVTMLLKFEELDMVQQLEREVKELARQNEQVEKQRERMAEFWGSAQQLTELWLYRTVPRLDLYKEVHSLLEDTEEDTLMKISSANMQLEELESGLGALEAWRSDGNISIDDKKCFGKAINSLCQEQELDSLLVKLEEVTTNNMKALQNIK